MGARKMSDEELRQLFERSDNESSVDGNDSALDPDYDPEKDSSGDESDMSVVENERDKSSGQAADGSSNTDAAPSQSEGGQTDMVRPTARSHMRTGNVLTRKRARDPSKWKCNVRKKLRQSGAEYINSRGNAQQARSVKGKKDCSKCKFKCSLNFSAKDREDVFNEFWQLDDNEKSHFFGKTTKQNPAVRKKSTSSRKDKSFSFYLPLRGNIIRVCKVFYLTTLDVNHKRVRTFHSNKRATGGTPVHLRWGKSANNVVSPEIKDGIREHINSIPRVESHYCRANTNKEYISPGLNITLLHEKYVEKCNANGTKPGKLHLYRQIFNSEFNIAFHEPKKDRCDICESMKMNSRPTEVEKTNYDKHIQDKTETKNERDKDRRDGSKFTVSFDLQNVFALPTADVSNFFYRRKLNVYHMTAFCSADKRGYGAIWNETQNGRSGNDIASSVVKLLEAIVQENSSDSRINKIILWSDSCVPQNRNSLLSTGIKVFLKTHPEIQSIEHKFCTPGHSSIQEVDNIHSQIERVCRNAEMYSPLSLLRMLKRVQRSKPMKLIQMKPTDFRDFHTIAQQGCYQKIPFTKVKSLLFEQSEPKVLKYKKQFSDDWTAENVIEQRTRRNLVSGNVVLFEVPDPPQA